MRNNISIFVGITTFAVIQIYPQQFGGICICKDNAYVEMDKRSPNLLDVEIIQGHVLRNLKSVH